MSELATFPRSSNIKSLEWFDSGDMKARFKGGAVYAYYGVPYALFEQLRDAKSIGKVFHAKIKQAGIKYRKLANDDEPVHPD